MGEMHTNITARKLCEMTSTKEDTLRMRFAKLHESNPAMFPDKWRIDGELNPKQVAALIQAGERKGSAPKEKDAASVPSTDEPMIQEQGRPIVVAPQKAERDIVGIAALAVAFLIPTLASAFNTYDVSHQVAKDWRVAMFIMVMVMFTPALFIVARMNWVGAFVAFGVVIFEGFCNLSAIYLSLMGNMEYILDGKRGVCSDFLQSVVNLTNSDHRPTAVLIGGALAALIALTQLTAFWAIRNRIK